MVPSHDRASAWSACPSRAVRTTALLATLAMAAFPALSARAAEPGASPSGSPARADTTRPVTFLKEIVVTGARYPRVYYRSPQALSFLTRRMLADEPVPVLGDALQQLPGVDMSKDSPWEQRPVLRGLSGQRVLVLVDGSPMNSARGNGPHPSLVDPEQVQRIEVVRGPSSVAYGSDALGGVINIITRDPSDVPSNRSLSGAASLGGSTVDRQSHAYLELVPRIGKFSAFLSSGGRKADDFEAPSGKVPNSGFKDYNALFNLRYDFTDRTALKGGYQLYRGKDIGIPGLSFSFPGATQEFSFSYYDRDFAHLTLDHQYRGTWLATTRARVYYQRERRNFYSDQTLADYLMPLFGVPGRTGAASVDTRQDRLLDLDTWGLQLQMTSVKTRRTHFTAGVDAASDRTGGDNTRYRTYYDASGQPVPDPSGGPTTGVYVTQSLPDGTFDNYAGFVQSEWFLTPRWTLSAGGRYTHYRYRTQAGVAAPASGPYPATLFQALAVDDNALSGSVGLVYEPVRDLHLSANVANGYREPNAQDLFFNGAASVGFVIGNPKLDPEKSVSYDFGLRWGPGTLGFSGDLFYSTYTDLIDAIQVASGPGPSTYQYVNISSARIWGGEAEAEWRFLPQWDARASMAGAVGDITSREAILTLYGVNADRANLGGVPPFRGTLSLRWTDASGRFWVEPSARYSWRTNRLPLPTPDVEQLTTFKKEWFVGDVFAGARFGDQRISLGVRNLADVHYEQPLGSLEEPGISFVGTLSTRF